MLTVKRKTPAYTISIWDFGSICKRYREIIPKVIVKFGAGDTVEDIVRNFAKKRKNIYDFPTRFDKKGGVFCVLIRYTTSKGRSREAESTDSEIGKEETCGNETKQKAGISPQRRFWR